MGIIPMISSIDWFKAGNNYRNIPCFNIFHRKSGWFPVKIFPSTNPLTSMFHPPLFGGSYRHPLPERCLGSAQRSVAGWIDESGAPRGQLRKRFTAQMTYLHM